MGTVYNYVKKYKNKYPATIAWRIKKHSEVVESYINKSEKVLYAFCAQKNDNWADIFSSAVIVLTSERILIGQKRLFWGSYYMQITPDMYNDMEIYNGLFFGRITIDTVKEEVVLTNLSKASLDDIETHISEFMMNQKKKYKSHEEINND